MRLLLVSVAFFSLIVLWFIKRIYYIRDLLFLLELIQTLQVDYKPGSTDCWPIIGRLWKSWVNGMVRIDKFGKSLGKSRYSDPFNLELIWAGFWKANIWTYVGKWFVGQRYGKVDIPQCGTTWTTISQKFLTLAQPFWANWENHWPLAVDY